MRTVEQRKFIAKGDNSEFSGDLYKTIDDKEPPLELLTYNLCILFHCLPSRLDEEDYDLITRLVVVHNTIAEVDEIRQEWEKKNLSADLGIALEIEKLKLKG